MAATGCQQQVLGHRGPATVDPKRRCFNILRSPKSCFTIFILAHLLPVLVRFDSPPFSCPPPTGITGCLHRESSPLLGVGAHSDHSEDWQLVVGSGGRKVPRELHSEPHCPRGGSLLVFGLVVPKRCHIGPKDPKTGSKSPHTKPTLAHIVRLTCHLLNSACWTRWALTPWWFGTFWG